MRTINIVVVALGLTVACGGSEETGESVEGAPSGVTSAAAPATLVLSRLGGMLVSAQEYHVEILPKSDGKVEALVLNAEGEVVPGADVDLEVKVTGDDGDMHQVQFAWSPEHHRYVGTLGGGVSVATGPAEVTVVVDGGTKSGSVPSLQVAAAPAHGGAVVVAGEYSVELVPDEQGKVIAYVVDAEGEAISIDTQAELKVNVGVGDAAREVAFVWDPDVGHYKGEVGTAVDISVAPMGVVLVTGGIEHTGHIVHVGRARAAALVNVVANAQGGVQLVAPGAAVDVAQTGTVSVRGPSGNVRVVGGGGGAAGNVRVRTPGANVAVNPGNVRVEAPNVRIRTGSGGVSVMTSGPSGSTMVVVGGGGGVRVNTPRPPRVTGMASAMGGISVGGAGGIRLGN